MTNKSFSVHRTPAAFNPEDSDYEQEFRTSRQNSKTLDSDSDEDIVLNGSINSSKNSTPSKNQLISDTDSDGDIKTPYRKNKKRVQTIQSDSDDDVVFSTPKEEIEIINLSSDEEEIKINKEAAAMVNMLNFIIGIIILEFFVLNF